MTYIALYRQWRPKQFKDVVGQEHITTTLKNQIIYNRIAHAYLFTGTRGTGKTSMAKIFAKAVNCTQHIQGEPCEDCEVCEGIESTRVMDILEIDAASNNGVDEIRELREKVKYPPSLGSFKVYIIDEVHMLSQGAFNALLKTLEEPPKHVIFILATTEPHKLPATILSRCQRFDFKRVSVKNMVSRMTYISKEMNINIEEKALELVAKKAEGALRDALSILDQCLSMAEEDQSVSYQDIVDTLGLAKEEWLYHISQSILEGNTQVTIELLHEMIDGGKDIIQIVKQLTEYFRNMLMVKALSQADEILELTQDQIDNLSKQGENASEEKIFRFIKDLSEAENKIKLSSQPTIIFEMELIKLCKNTKDKSLESLIERVELLEKNAQPSLQNKRMPDKQPSKIKDKPPSISKHVENKGLKEDRPKDQKPQDKELSVNKELSLNDINKKWQKILKEVKKQGVQVEALLKEGKPVRFIDNRLIISFDLGFHQAKLSEKENIELLERVISGEMGTLVKVECVMKEESPIQDQENDPVKAAIEVFGEDLVEVVDNEEN